MMNQCPAPVPPQPPSFYEKFVPIQKCELDPVPLPTSKIYLKGRLFYDSVEDNKEYTYDWAFVRVPEVAQPIKVRSLQFMNRAFDLDEVYIQLVNWLQWEKAQPKFTKHLDFNRHLKSALDEVGPSRTDMESDAVDEDEFDRGTDISMPSKVAPHDDDNTGEAEDEEKKSDGEADEDDDQEDGEEDGEEEPEDEYYGDYYGYGDYEQEEDTEKPPEGEYYDGYYDEEGNWVDNQQWDGYYDDEGVWHDNPPKEGGDEEAGDDEDDEFGAQEEDYESEITESEFEESDDDEYGELYEESIKEFSMSLTKEQLELFNEMNQSPKSPEEEQKAEAEKAILEQERLLHENKKLFKLPPILKVPKFSSKLELTMHLNSEEMRHYRPQAKVVRIVSSRMTEANMTHEGTMFRKRMSKKTNKYKQVIKPHNKHLPPLFMLDDQKLIETKHREVTFKIVGWREKWPIAKLVS